MSVPFHVKRKRFIQTFVRPLLGVTVVAFGILILTGAARGSAAYKLLEGAVILIALWWVLR